MAIELQMLLFAAVLGLVQLLVATHFATMQRGAKWNVSSREEPMPPLKGVAGRLERAFKNFMETFPIFAALALLSFATQQADNLTALGSQIYLGARVLHFIIYALGITIVRSLVWLVSLVGIVMMIFGLF